MPGYALKGNYVCDGAMATEMGGLLAGQIAWQNR